MALRSQLFLNSSLNAALVFMLLLQVIFCAGLLAEDSDQVQVNTPKSSDSVADKSSVVPTSPLIDLSDFSLDLHRGFLDRLTGRASEMPKEVIEDPPITRVERGIWINNVAQLEAEVTGVVLRFDVDPLTDEEAKDESESGEEEEVDEEEEELVSAGTFGTAEVPQTDPDKGPVYVGIDFHRQGVVVTHSHARWGAHRGGVRFPAKKRFVDFTSMFIEGRRGPGVGVIVPQPEGKVRNSVMMCLRDVVTGVYPEGLRKGQSYSHYPESQYKPNGAKFLVDGIASGRVLSGLGIGFARAVVLTTKNVIPSQPFFDQNYAEDPTAFVEYYPALKKDADWTIPDGKFNGGIRAQVTLQNAVGYKRTTWRQQVLQVRRVQMPGKIRIRVRKGWGNIDPGVCYILYRETKFKAMYSKEELVIPEQYRAKLEKEETPDIVIQEPGTGLYGENPL